MLLSDLFGLIAIVCLLVAILCAFNGRILNIEILLKLALISVDVAIVCFIVFVILSVIP